MARISTLRIMYSKASTFNRCDIYLVILIASLALGGIGGALTPVRLLTILFFPAFTLRYEYSKHYLKPYLYAFAVFYLYALLSMIWTPDKTEGMKELIYYPIHFLLFLETITFGRFARQPLTSVSVGWLIAVFITLPIAGWEYITDHHLSTSRYGSDGVKMANLGTIRVQQHFAAATFTNMNSYVVFLCYALPFLFYGFVRSRIQKLRKNYYIFAILLSALCVMFNASRGGFLTLVLMGLIYMVVSAKMLNKLWFIAVFFAGLILVTMFADSMLAIIQFRANSDNLLQGESRLVIWNNAWETFKPTLGLGVGIGGMTKAMISVTKGITATHNIFFEILLQYGVIFFGGFIYYLIQLSKKALLVNIKVIKLVLLLALIPMPVYLIINSGYLLDPALYVLFACITVFIDYERTQLLHKFIRRIV